MRPMRARDASVAARGVCVSAARATKPDGDSTGVYSAWVAATSTQAATEFDAVAHVWHSDAASDMVSRPLSRKPAGHLAPGRSPTPVEPRRQTRS